MKPTIDGLKPMESDQLNYSREEKKQFLVKQLEKGPFKVNSVFNSELTNIKTPSKKIYPHFTIMYSMVRTQQDIEQWLEDS